MRKTLTVAVLLGTAALMLGQEPPPVPPRYGVPPNLELYPQGTPKQALASAVRAVERGKFDYLAAHLIDPRVIDARVVDRARGLEVATDRELRVSRQTQQANPLAIAREDQIPDDPVRFGELVRAEAARRAFRQVTQDVSVTLGEYPRHLQDLQRYLRAGTFVDAGDVSSVTLPDAPGRGVFFRNVGGRWFVEDRREPAADAIPTPAADKK